MIESKTNFNPTSFYDSNITCSIKKKYIIPAKFYNGRFNDLRLSSHDEWIKLVKEDKNENN